MALSRRGTIWHYDFLSDGRRYRGSTRETNRARALRVQAWLMVEVKEKRSLISNSKIPTLSVFSKRFLEWVEASTLEAATKRYYRYGWEMIQGMKLREVRLHRITPDMADVIRLGSPAKTNVALRTLRRMFSKAVEWGVIRHAPRIRLRKELGREALIGPEAEAKLLAAAKEPLRDVILIMQDTGMRPQDVFRMRWEHVDWFKKTIFIPFGKTKNSRRYVPMSERMMDALRMRRGKSETWVFSSKLSRSGHITNVAKQWLDARKRAGLGSSVKLYSCRHTFATDTLERTGNLAALMKLLGHSDAQTAMRYQHPGIEEARKAVDKRNREYALLLGEGSPQKSPQQNVPAADVVEKIGCPPGIRTPIC